ncbi:hypothetical protein MMAD_18500 [Mycolicibacterium madagascariense]|uniref:YCII-related domain-containing protein n=1 Tax=Mycolicibacterium madagascariense TaxID=212765 RepID=A0A7I7XDR0_9MYCO|nr:YciI family protein [Mycolicibacterium madagascariense]MCV7015262.1 hypothetical protein [Mycolicibacterium madagascariense]BBZ27555.1 hypothetical protein MMAD_18500 [Mycolicibacterium madagascariense]
MPDDSGEATTAAGFYLVLRHDTASNKNPESVGEHLAWMRAQHERGTVLISGPSADGALGIYVIRAASFQRATDIAGTDPLSLAEGVRVEVIDWNVHQILGIGSFEPPRG